MHRTTEWKLFDGFTSEEKGAGRNRASPREKTMAFAGLNNVEHIEVRVKTIRHGMDVIIDNALARGKGEDGDYQITISWERGCIKTVRRLGGLIEELEAMGLEYVPRKRVYRR